MKRLIIAFLVITYHTALLAQPTIKQFISKGDEALSDNNFQSAMHHYYEAVERDDADVDVLYKYALSSFKSYAYKESKWAFDKVLELDEDNTYPEATFYLGSITHQMGSYEDAIRNYDLYLSENLGDDPQQTKLAQRGVEHATWAAAQDEKDYPETDILHLDATINSPYSEHGAQVRDGKLYYSSLKFESEKDIYSKERYISKVLVSDQYEVAVADDFNKFNDDNVLTSSTSFSDDGQLMAYSICEYDLDGQIMCKLFLSELSPEGDILTQEAFPAVVNMPGYTATQPSFGPTINDKKVIYFVSDRIGGEGGLDIWYTTLNKDKKFSSPKNVTSINTAGNDITPNWDVSTQALYFSSDDRLGFGGFDVYQATEDFPTPKQIQNLGPKVNSSYNDIYFSRKDGEAYLSSNRPGSQYLESKFETCCYDIYQVDFEKCSIDLLTLILDKDNGEAVKGASITVQRSSGSPIFIERLDTHEFNLEVDCDEEITITVSKDGYEPETLTLNMSDIDGDSFEQKMYLKKRSQQLQVLTFERATKNALAGATISLVDGNNESQTLDIHTNESGNDFYFNVAPNTSYKIIATKNGYEQEVMSFTTGDLKEAIVKKIYMGRLANIATLADLIPVRLYYDNDEPDKSTMSTTTDKMYSYTYYEYYERKPVFKEKYGSYYDIEHAYLADDLIDNFFDNEVKKGYEQMSIFMETLVRVLETGKNVNLYLRGYTSPLSQDEYNAALGKRRIAAIKNEFDRYNNGILLPYIRSGQLVLTERSFGETTSPQHVSDDPSAPSKSIYSPSASRERRIEIDEIVEIHN